MDRGGGRGGAGSEAPAAIARASRLLSFSPSSDRERVRSLRRSLAGPPTAQTPSPSSSSRPRGLRLVRERTGLVLDPRWWPRRKMSRDAAAAEPPPDPSRRALRQRGDRGRAHSPSRIPRRPAPAPRGPCSSTSSVRTIDDMLDLPADPAPSAVGAVVSRCRRRVGGAHRSRRSVPIRAYVR